MAILPVDLTHLILRKESTDPQGRHYHVPFSNGKKNRKEQNGG